jgi:pyruvate kinase
MIAITSEEATARRLAMVWGVRSVVVPVVEDPDTMFRLAGQAVINSGLGRPDEYVLIVGSLPMMHVAGRTNLVHVRRLGT